MMETVQSHVSQSCARLWSRCSGRRRQRRAVWRNTISSRVIPTRLPQTVNVQQDCRPLGIYSSSSLVRGQGQGRWPHFSKTSPTRHRRPCRKFLARKSQVARVLPYPLAQLAWVRTAFDFYSRLGRRSSLGGQGRRSIRLGRGGRVVLGAPRDPDVVDPVPCDGCMHARMSTGTRTRCTTIGVWLPTANRAARSGRSQATLQGPSSVCRRILASSIRGRWTCAGSCGPDAEKMAAHSPSQATTVDEGCYFFIWDWILPSFDGDSRLDVVVMIAARWVSGID